jgi:hypothetical protein
MGVAGVVRDLGESENVQAEQRQDREGPEGTGHEGYSEREKLKR